MHGWQDVSAPISVERGVVGGDVDGLLHPTLEPSVVLVEHTDVPFKQVL